jgi:hypothetical protein
LPALAVPPSGAATTFAFAGGGSFLGLVNAPPPYMSSYQAIPPFDTATQFVLPNRSSLDTSNSMIATVSYIKAKA